MNYPEDPTISEYDYLLNNSNQTNENNDYYSDDTGDTQQKVNSIVSNASGKARHAGYGHLTDEKIAELAAIERKK